MKKRGDSDEQIIAVYLSMELAQKAIEKFKIQLRFIGHEHDFYISEYTINCPEWREGYFWLGDLKGGKMNKMYVYNLVYEKPNKGIGPMNIGYFSSYKKARDIKKKYQTRVPGFKDHGDGFKIKKIEINRDNYYFYK